MHFPIVPCYFCHIPPWWRRSAPRTALQEQPSTPSAPCTALQAQSCRIALHTQGCEHSASQTALYSQRSTHNAAINRSTHSTANTVLHAHRTHMLQALRWMLQRLPPWLCVQHKSSRSCGGFSPTLPVSVERWRTRCRNPHFSSSAAASALPPANPWYPAPPSWWSVGARPTQCGTLALQIARGIVAGERPL